jgi:hypothetical protein
MRTIYNLFRYYRRRGASNIAAARNALRVYHNGF